MKRAVPKHRPSHTGERTGLMRGEVTELVLDAAQRAEGEGVGAAAPQDAYQGNAAAAAVDRRAAVAAADCRTDESLAKLHDLAALHGGINAGVGHPAGAGAGRTTGLADRSSDCYRGPVGVGF